MTGTFASGGRCARSRRCALFFACAALIWCVSAAPGSAQQPGRQPGYDPQQTERRIERLRTDQDRAAKPGVHVPGIPRAPARGDTRPLFELKTVSIDGANVIASPTLAATYQVYLGKTISQADLIAIAAAITEIYREAGYHLSRAIVPAQDIKDGHVRIRVIEGSITEITLKGNGVDTFGIKAVLASIAEERPSLLTTVERQLLLVNDRPGVRIADVALDELRPTSGHFRLIVTVETWRIFAAQGIDNYGSSPVGPWELLSTTAFNSSLLPGDTLALSLSTVPDHVRELQFGRASYDAPIGTDGVRAGGSALYSDVWPGDARRLLNTHTLTETYELHGTIVPLETRRSTLWLTAGVAFTDASERDSLGLNYRDHVRTLNLTADYKLQDHLAGWNYLTVTARQGLDALGASTDWDQWTSRAGASPNFSLIDLNFTRIQKLSDIWSVKLSATGQWASGPLLLSQQFYLGDGAYGPGYYSGDNGLFGLAELRYDQTLPYTYLKGYQLYAFFDRGQVWNFDSDGVALSLSSIGAGIRLFMTDQTLAGIGVAVPVHWGTTANQVSDVRVLFTFSNSFKLCPERPQLRCL
jgi:hemolysin activation/secretion protein